MMLLRKWIKVLFFVCWGVAWWYRDLIGEGFFWCAAVMTGLVVMLNWQDAYSLCPERKWRGDPNLFLLAATAPWWGLLNPMHEVSGWRWWLWACVSPLWLLFWAVVGMWMRRWVQMVLPALVLLGLPLMVWHTHQLHCFELPQIRDFAKASMWLSGSLLRAAGYLKISVSGGAIQNFPLYRIAAYSDWVSGKIEVSGSLSGYLKKEGGRCRAAAAAGGRAGRGAARGV